MATISSHGLTEHRFVPFLEESTDSELLELFITAKDDSAFAELVRRHAAMVLGVCRRVLHNAHDAEDCFQAVFLVLVRKADTIKPRAMVGNWLYGVAYRTALEARKLAARRRNMERKKPAPTEDDHAHDRWQDLGPLLDQELNRLPDKYRAVIVACDLEGKTREEAARALGLPEGTIASRLARGRALLAKRLKRYVLNMTTTGIAALLLETAQPPEVPETLLTATIDAGVRLAGGQPTTGLVSRNVASLADAVVAGFYLAKLKIAGVALATLFALGVIVGTMLPSAQAERKIAFRKPDAGKAPLEPRQAKPKRVLDCIVQNIDLERRMIDATSAAGDESIHVHVTPETHVVINGRETTLADLSVGAAVNVLEYAEVNGRQTALRLEVAGTWIHGFVSTATDDSVQVKADGKTFDIDKNATVLVDGKEVKLGALKTKMDVKVKVGADKVKVERIDAVGPKRKGAVKAIDAVRQTITLEGVAEGITVAPDVPVYIDGRRNTLAALKTGDRVTLQMSAQTPACVIAIRNE